jgi:hypothetical protein
LKLDPSEKLYFPCELFSNLILIGVVSLELQSFFHCLGFVSEDLRSIDTSLKFLSFSRI